MSTSREWIKAGPDPLRYEYARENPDAGGAPIIDALAYVEQTGTGHFAWETYTDPPERAWIDAEAEHGRQRARTVAAKLEAAAGALRNASEPGGPPFRRRP